MCKGLCVSDNLIRFFCVLRCFTRKCGRIRRRIVLFTMTYGRNTQRIWLERLAYIVVYDTAIYDRNTVASKRAIYGPYTVVIIACTAVYAGINGCVRPFTVAVIIHLGCSELNHILQFLAPCGCCHQ